MSETWQRDALAVCRFLGSAANGQAADIASLPDETVLLGFSKVHRLVTAVSSALRRHGADETAYPTLHKIADTAAFHQVKNDLLTSQILDALTNRGVTVQPLKGAAIQAVYPDGWIRTATDTDLFVPSEHLAAATAVLTAAGFSRQETRDGETVFRKPPRSVIELHTDLGGFSASQRTTLARLSQTPFTVNEQYVYTVFHLYKHFVYAGAGVRLFFDAYRLSDAVTDRGCVERWLHALGLSGFERAVDTVNGILFDGNEASDSMAEVIDLVLRSGTFGTEETYHAMTSAAQKVTRKSRLSVWMTDHGFTVDAMIARYPSLEHRLWLYPVYAVHRVTHGFFFNRAVLRRAVKVGHTVDRRHIRRILGTMNIL